MLRDEILGYSASKHAALALTHAIRRAGWDDGVRHSHLRTLAAYSDSLTVSGE